MTEASSPTSAVIIPFPSPKSAGLRLTARDRADLRTWEARERGHGYAQATICADDHVMVCWQGSLWTIRACTEPGGRFQLARYPTPMVGHFATLNDALAVLDGKAGRSAHRSRAAFATRSL